MILKVKKDNKWRYWEIEYIERDEETGAIKTDLCDLTDYDQAYITNDKGETAEIIKAPLRKGACEACKEKVINDTGKLPLCTGCALYEA